MADRHRGQEKLDHLKNIEVSGSQFDIQFVLFLPILSLVILVEHVRGVARGCDGIERKEDEARDSGLGL